MGNSCAKLCARLMAMLVVTAGFSSNAADFSCGFESVASKEEFSNTDCLPTFTNPTPYLVGQASRLYRVPLVFHLIQRDSAGTSNLPDSVVYAQLRRINAEFLRIPGISNPATVNTRIMFSIAQFDPSGAPASGIVRTVNQQWYDMTSVFTATDSGMATSLNWDPARFHNVYKIGAFIGGAAKAPWVFAGTPYDGIRLGHDYFSGGEHGTYAVHELGHSLALHHDYGGYFGVVGQSCDSIGYFPPGCYHTGDTVCDTPFNSSVLNHCDEYDPYTWCTGTEFQHDVEAPFNFMSYRDDECRKVFTPEQAARMRCGLLAYHQALFDSIAVTITGNSRADSSRFMCPGGTASGTGAKKYVVTVDFVDAGMRHDIAAHELTLVPPASSVFEVWPAVPGDSTVADSAATAENGFTTTFTIDHFSGCGADSMEVRLNDVMIGKAYFNVNTADFLPVSPGAVDSGDLAALAGHLGCSTCPPCFDFNANDGLVDSGEIAKFASHLGHFSPGYASKALMDGGSLAFSIEEQGRDTAAMGVHLEGLGTFEAVAIAVRYDASVVEFVSWQQDASVPELRTFAIPVLDSEGPRVILLALDEGRREWPSERMGRIIWRTARSLDLDRDIRVTHADMALPGGQVIGLRRAGKADEPPHVDDLHDWLEPGEPNPFNPTTTLRYAIGRDGNIYLSPSYSRQVAYKG